LAQEFVHPTNVVSVSQGNTQLQANGNAFIGWGSAPVFTEFNSSGDLLFNGRFPQGGSSYRASRFPWIGNPSDSPVAVVQKGEGSAYSVFASWNGATEIATWEVLAGDDPNQLDSIGSADRTGFETKIEVSGDAANFAVQAKDKSGKVLGVSEVVKPTS